MLNCSHNHIDWGLIFYLFVFYFKKTRNQFQTKCILMEGLEFLVQWSLFTLVATLNRGHPLYCGHKFLALLL